MGVFTTCGGLSRVIGPIAISTIYQHLGTYWTFGSILVILGVALFLAIVSYQNFKVKEDVINPSTDSKQAQNDTVKKSGSDNNVQL